MINDNQIEIKIITIGNAYVGKTSIVSQFINNELEPNLVPTVGMDVKSHELIINNKKINLKIWDSAGQERFRSIQKNYYNKVDGIIFVYDVTNQESFNLINDWLNEVIENTKKNVNCIIVGNKIDLTEERKISYETGKNFAASVNYKFFECSAITGENIKLAFETLCKDIIESDKFKNFHDDENPNNRSINLYFSNNEKTKKKCCKK